MKKILLLATLGLLTLRGFAEKIDLGGSSHCAAGGSQYAAGG